MVCQTSVISWCYPRMIQWAGYGRVPKQIERTWKNSTCCNFCRRFWSNKLERIRTWHISDALYHLTASNCGNDSSRFELRDAEIGVGSTHGATLAEEVDQKLHPRRDNNLVLQFWQHPAALAKSKACHIGNTRFLGERQTYLASSKPEARLGVNMAIHGLCQAEFQAQSECCQTYPSGPCAKSRIVASTEKMAA